MRKQDEATAHPCGGKAWGNWIRSVGSGLKWEMIQLRWLVHRNLVKSTRAFWPGTVLDVLLLQGAAFIVGSIQVGRGVAERGTGAKGARGAGGELCEASETQASRM
jgi:hypothetical protein